MIAPGLNLERQAEALARAQRHWQEQPGPTRRVKHAWSVAVTREAGALGTTVAAEIGQRLGWPVYDRTLIERIAEEMGLRSNLLDSVDEKRKSWLIECLEGLTVGGPVSDSKFVRRLVETLLSLSTIGHCVIVGRGAAHILPVQSTLRVRLVGAKPDRIEAIKNRLHLTAEQAVRWIEDTDRERTRFVKDHFNRDPNDASNYDLVLNTSRWSASECADLIIDSLKKLEARE